MNKNWRTQYTLNISIFYLIVMIISIIIIANIINEYSFKKSSWNYNLIGVILLVILMVIIFQLTFNKLKYMPYKTYPNSSKTEISSFVQNALDDIKIQYAVYKDKIITLFNGKEIHYYRFFECENDDINIGVRANFYYGRGTAIVLLCKKSTKQETINLIEKTIDKMIEKK